MGPQDAPVPVVAPSATSVPTSSGTITGVPLTVQAYFLRGDHLVRISRTVPPGTGLGPSLAALSEPLSAAELAEGIRTAIPVSATPLQARLTTSGTAQVSVPPGFDRLSVREQENALAQLVFTVTANTLASSLQLVHGTRVVPVPDDTGQILARPVTREDYARLRPA